MNKLVNQILFMNSVRRSDFYELKQKLLSGLDINFVVEGTIPLEVASYAHHLKMVKLLLEHGANPNIIFKDELTFFFL